MGHLTRLDSTSVLDVAARYDTAADLLDTALRSHLSRLRFDGSRAGRSYTDAGDAVRLAVERAAAQLTGWACAARGIATALRASEQAYVDADAHVGRRLG